MATTLLARAASALEALDAAALVTLYAEPFVFEDVPGGEVIDTAAGLRAYFDALFSFPDVRFRVASSFECGDDGALEWEWSGTNHRTGEPFTVRGASLIVFGPDGIRQETLFYDPAPAR